MRLDNLLQTLFMCKFKDKLLSIRSPKIFCSVTVRTDEPYSERLSSLKSMYFLSGYNT